MFHKQILIYFIAFFFLASVNQGAIAQDFPLGFQETPALWHGQLCVGDEVCAIGDVNGDGRDDVVVFIQDTAAEPRRADVMVALSTGTSFGPASVWHDLMCVGNEICAVADVNGDGRDDVLAFVRDAAGDPNRGNVWVALSTGSNFGPPEIWHDFFCQGNEICATGDVNGDSRDDVIAFTGDTAGEPARGNVWLSLSTGTGFGEVSVYHDFFCVGYRNCTMADVTGDGQDDVVGVVQQNVQAMVALRELHQGEVFVAPQAGNAGGDLWDDDFCIFDAATCVLGDVNGDGYADLVRFLRDSEPNLIGFDMRQGRVDVALTTNTGFGDFATQHTFFCIGNEECQLGDVDGDGRDDLIAFVRDTKTGDGRGDVFVALSELPKATLTIGNIPALTQPTPVTSMNAIPLTIFKPQVGQNAVVTQAGDNLQVRTGPGAGFQPVTTLAADETVLVLEGPIEATGFTWWRVQGIGGAEPFVGWTAEGDGNEIWLISAVDSNPAPVEPGSTPGQLTIGDQAIVTVAGDGLRVRSGPGTQFTATGNLNSGQLVCVIDGPNLADGLTWWAVAMIPDNTNSGWVAEAADGEIWLEEHIDNSDPGETVCN